MTTIDRTPKPCRCPKARHVHGTRMAYIADRCRCLPCCAANADYARVQNRQHAYGRTPNDWVDAEPVRRHVHAILATGVGWKRIGKVARVSSGTMTNLLYGKSREDGRRDAPCRRMNPDAAARLLALPLPTITQLPGGVPVDGTRVGKAGILMTRQPRFWLLTPPPQLTTGEWRDHAACHEHPRLLPEAWDDTTDGDGHGKASRRGKRIAAAINVCRTECPVRDACLADADLRWDEGVRGGIDLRALREKRSAS